jgi:hypothetical protein
MQRIFISADHGLAVIYFLQSDVVPSLLDAGVEVVVLTDDALIEQVAARFGQVGMHVEGLRIANLRRYESTVSPTSQWWLHFLRRAGASNQINLEAVNGFMNQVEDEAHQRRKMLFPIMRVFVEMMRRSKMLRRLVVQAQNRYTPNVYTDLFEKYKPNLVVAATPGWRLDRYLLREASNKGVTTATVIVGWDNSSSYSLPGAPVDWATCWSKIQKSEMVLGSDWKPERVNIGGIPSYDGYIRGTWLLPRDEYFAMHDLDLNRRLISYASSFVSFSPDTQNIEALAQLVEENQLVEPSQLLVRLHPTHYLDQPHYAREREIIQKMATDFPHVHVVEPVSLGGGMGYYSGEDMPEKSSMMAYSDVMVTVYSTMVVEASLHGTPVISLVIDSQEGWPSKYTLPLSKISGWPTHLRYRESGAGREATNQSELRDSLNYYLSDPKADHDSRQAFLKQECSFLDGSAGKRTARYLMSLIR